MNFRQSFVAAAISAIVCGPVLASTPAQSDILDNYANIAQATYEDSLLTAQELNKVLNLFLAKPTEENLKKARAAWIAARVPYQQSEAFRFGNPIVDDWEGKVNAWPLDEGLIDYVAAGYGAESDENPFYTANIVANSKLKVGGVEIDASKIDKKLLAETLHEIDEVEANVATGYHAIEFLLWGQDLNGNNPGAGNRPATDFDLENCTHGNCDRRRDYLMAATELLIDDLQEMTNNWAPQGPARTELLSKAPAEGIATILTGMGSLAYGELAGERTKLGLMLHDPEEEHDCFSDNTHNSHFYDAKGIKNVYLGEYTRVDGSTVSGASLAELIKHQSPAVDQDLRNNLDRTENAAQAMVDEAAKGNTFDVLIGVDNKTGNQVVQTFVDALVAEAESIENAIAALKLEGIELEGSDSLDNPASISAE
ncbi:imelysin family protein [Neptuniibacter sp. 1_MG-2023]|uniref:imelysin family protein n=1 Tax=Neptuniibacter sp. 1_MG-2023 TaxID=3062662 RepID=UPI0026E16F88|nr:imelysin family protein [Neptuniibacter sp. 1_MG-2023]MDO6594080.1 imelysin family protein [Neptuniibacter sp. 1_MG-2023]